MQKVEARLYYPERTQGAEEPMGATIGLVGRSSLPVDFCEYLWKHPPDVKFVDATDQIDQNKATQES